MCADKIKLYSRYADVDTKLEFIDDSRGIITTNGAYVRVGTKCDNDLKDSKIIDFIDFEGGPMVSVGDVIKDNKKIKSIKSCYLVEFEEDDISS